MIYNNMTHIIPLVHYLQTHHFIDQTMADTLVELDDYALVRSALIEGNVMTGSHIDKLESLFSGLPLWNGSISAVDPSVQSLVPLQVSHQERIVCVEKKGQRLCLVTDHNVVPHKVLQLINSTHKTDIFRVPTETLDVLLDRYTRQTESALVESISHAASRMRKTGQFGSRSMALLFPRDHRREIAEDVSTVALIKKLVALADIKEASQIMIQTLSDKVMVRMMIANQTYDITTLPLDVAPSIYLTLRYLCDMSLDDCTSIEQGTTQLVHVHNNVGELSVTFTPTVSGVSMTIHCQTREAGYQVLNELGMNVTDTQLLRDWCHGSHGMVIVTGRESSGKSFAVYQLLQAIKHYRSVASLEKSIEYVIDGVNQVTMSTRPDRDIQTLSQDHDVVAILPLSQNLALPVSNISHSRLVVAETAKGIMGYIKTMLDQGVALSHIADTVDYNIISARFDSLDITQVSREKLSSGEIATIEKYMSCGEFSHMLHTQGLIAKPISHFSQVTWQVAIDRSPWWLFWRRTSQQMMGSKKEPMYVRSLLRVGDRIHRSYSRHTNLVELEQDIKEQQKKSLLPVAIALAFQGKISIKDIIDMLRT